MDLLMHQLRALVVLVLLVGGCKPEITGDTYYCGPERLCPEGLSCQVGLRESFAYSCVRPRATLPFQCPTETLDREPDSTPNDAHTLASLVCGDQAGFSNWGCIADGQDMDHFEVQILSECPSSSTRFTANLRYPIGTAPLQIELLSSDDTVVAISELCTPELDTKGTDSQCLDHSNLVPGFYHLRVSIDEAANADCGGACSFNQYQLSVALPL